MKDQVRSCQERGVAAAAAVTCDDKSSEKEAMKGVYISPEMILGTKKWRSVLDTNLYQSRLVGLVIDEAHCVKTWGDFHQVFKSWAI
uniref:Helicase ATP-binding domain-containing protein n=1 Tax=Amphimedon queenslandica TaxID=400682 RepID=A0A1X7U797_AMPQE